MKVRAKKHLGQHFLKDLGIAGRITDSLQSGSPADTLEIGPGTGVLTQFLINRPDIELTVIEIDSESIVYLRDNYPGLDIIEGDFLRLELDAIFPGGVNIIGNFPYNISSQIFFRILDYKDIVPQVVCMLQKEVAVRIAEPPGKKDYGILSVFLQAYYDIEYLFDVPPGVFSPPPKVNSGVIRLTRNKVTRLDCDEVLFRKVVKAAFNQRRKTLRNSLRAAFPGLPADHPLMGERPERLSVADFMDITRYIEKYTAESEI